MVELPSHQHLTWVADNTPSGGSLHRQAMGSGWVMAQPCFGITGQPWLPEISSFSGKHPNLRLLHRRERNMSLPTFLYIKEVYPLWLSRLNWRHLSPCFLFKVTHSQRKNMKCHQRAYVEKQQSSAHPHQLSTVNHLHVSVCILWGSWSKGFHHWTGVTPTKRSNSVSWQF